MSTRCKVAIKKDLGLIIAVYNHFDSYIEGLGKTLVEKYNSRKLAQKFVDKIADDNDYEFSLYGSEEEYCKRNENSDLNYIYLWRDDEWVYKRYPFTSEWYSVKDDLNANVNIQDVSLDTDKIESSELSLSEIQEYSHKLFKSFDSLDFKSNYNYALQAIYLGEKLYVVRCNALDKYQYTLVEADSELQAIRKCF